MLIFVVERLRRLGFVFDGCLLVALVISEFSVLGVWSGATLLCKAASATWYGFFGGSAKGFGSLLTLATLLQPFVATLRGNQIDDGEGFR